jgi:hypothetical protein
MDDDNYDPHCVRLADPTRKLDDLCELWAITFEVDGDQLQYLHPIHLKYLEMEQAVEVLKGMHLGNSEASHQAIRVLNQTETLFAEFWATHGNCECECSESPCRESGWNPQEVEFIQSALRSKLHRLEEVAGVDAKEAGDMFMACAALVQVLFLIMRRWFDNGPYPCC